VAFRTTKFEDFTIVANKSHAMTRINSRRAEITLVQTHREEGKKREREEEGKKKREARE